MDHTKRVLAEAVQDFVIHKLEFLMTIPVDEAIKWEAKPISALSTEVKVWPKQGGPRYFVIQVKESM